MTTTASSSPQLGVADGRDLSWGLLGAGVAVCAWSAGTILAKGIEMGGLALGAYRFWMFSALIVAWMALRRTPLTWRVMKASVWGGIALGADIALFFSAVKLTSVVNATIIGSLQPILVGAVAARFFGEKIRPRDAAWSVVALAGVVVIIAASADNGATDWRGDLLAVGALLSWSGYFITSKQSKGRMTSLEFTAGTSVWSGVICTPLGFLFGQDMSFPSAKNIGLLLVMIAISGIVGHVLMNWSLVRIPLWIGSTFTLLIPVFSALLAWVFFDEEILLVQGVAMAGVIGALAVVVRGQSSAAKAAAVHKAVLDDGLVDRLDRSLADATSDDIDDGAGLALDPSPTDTQR
ncbi:MAG: DMT family transporter [Ilumatobacter sp.]|uniref:DMT family transporter n=1 Tax=Ilumatobacter sp. TaxID=1967498 RepID=UPI003298DACB